MPYVFCVLLACHRMPYTTLAKAIYFIVPATLPSPSCWGITSADDRLKMERFINKSKHLGSKQDVSHWVPTNQETIETMIGVADRPLLRAVVTRNNHVLLTCSLFPPIKAIQYNFRHRPHNLKLPEKYNVNFIPRVLYKH